MHKSRDGDVLQDTMSHEEEGENILTMLAPHITNSKGAVVVEVEKVVRDLVMVTKTIRGAKFYRVLLGFQATQEPLEDNWMETGDQEKVVVIYRELLNNFFKLVHRLNTATD